MTWALFLDDDRVPADPNSHNWKLARNVDDAMYYVRAYGLPTHMALDHDLGAGKMTGMDFVRQFVNYLMDNDLTNSWNQQFYIHSQNPVGADNMQSYLDGFILEIGY